MLQGVGVQVPPGAPSRQVSGEAMPNIKSAEKRIRQSEKNRAKNRAVKSKINTARKPVLEGKGDKETMAKAIAEYSSVLDKAVKQGVIKRNTADRRKARAAKRLAAAE